MSAQQNVVEDVESQGGSVFTSSLARIQQAVNVFARDSYVHKDEGGGMMKTAHCIIP